MAGRRETVVMFPFMAQGHIIPFLALALHIESKGYNIIFVNTPLNIKKLRQSIPPSSSIRLREILFNSSDDAFPPGVENTDVLPYSLVIRFLEASTTLKPAFRSLLCDIISELAGDPPLCVIADIFFGWSAEVARDLGIFHVVFSGAGGFGLACYYSMWLNLPHRRTDSAEFTLPDFPESGCFHVTQLTAAYRAADGTDAWSIFQQRNLPKWVHSNGILFNSVAGIDEVGLAYFRRKLGLPVWPVGPVLLAGDNRARASKEAGITPEKCRKWLDTKPENSVLYISFGSMNTISASHMMQLAKALQGGDVNFIWVVRPPLGSDINAEFKAEEWLPENFINQAVEEQRRGLIVVQWAPQVEILSHKSVGAFLTHCGWNSVLEALSRGVPLLGWPMAAEQFFTSKFLAEEIGVSVEMARGTNLEVRYGDLAEKIKMVMGGSDKGKEMRRKACELRDLIKDAVRDEEEFKGSSMNAMDEFLKDALLMKTTKTLTGTAVGPKTCPKLLSFT